MRGGFGGYTGINLRSQFISAMWDFFFFSTRATLRTDTLATRDDMDLVEEPAVVLVDKSDTVVELPEFLDAGGELDRRGDRAGREHEADFPRFAGTRSLRLLLSGLGRRRRGCRGRDARWQGRLLRTDARGWARTTKRFREVVARQERHFAGEEDETLVSW